MSLYRRVKRRYGLATRRVAVRPHIGWHWRGLFMAFALAVGLVLAWWLFDVGSRFAGFERGLTTRELGRLQAKVKQLEEDNARLVAAKVKTESHSKIDSAAQRDLERMLKALQDENAQLKEELAFFRGAMTGDRAAGLNIYRLSVERAAPGVYHYRLMLVLAGQRDKVFRGSLKMLIKAQEGNNQSLLTFPAGDRPGTGIGISLNSYQKLEGEFRVPTSSVVKTVEARIYEDGSTQPKVTKLVNVP